MRRVVGRLPTVQRAWKVASRGGRTSLQWLRVWGALSRCLRDAGVGRTAWTGEDAPTRVGEHPREALRDVGPAV